MYSPKHKSKHSPLKVSFSLHPPLPPNKQKLSIQQLLNESSIDKIDGAELSRRDLISQSPQHWIINDTSKDNFILIEQVDQKEIGLFEDQIEGQKDGNQQDLPSLFVEGQTPHIEITKENQDINYRRLQKEYQKLMKQQREESEDSENQNNNNDDQYQYQYERDESGLGGLLNMSQSREDNFFRRQSLLEEKIEDIVKMVHRIVSLKNPNHNKILNSSINLSRHSQYKQSITKNLFEINEELDNLQGGAKVNKQIDIIRVQDQDEQPRFVLRDHYNNGQIDMDMRQFKRKEIAVSIIKKYWHRYKTQSNPLSLPTLHTHPTKLPDQLQHQHQPSLSKQQDFNHILNQLDQSSNNINNDKSQELSLQYKELTMVAKNIAKINNSNSFYEQKRKKGTGDSLVLEHLGSISAIRSTSKFRQASQYDDSEIKEQDSRYYYEGINVSDVLRRRESWIEAKSKEDHWGSSWGRKEMEMIQKFKTIIMSPYQPCVPLTKQISINTLQTIPYVQPQRDISFDFKDLPRLKQSFHLLPSRPLIQRKNKPLSSNKVSFGKHHQKDKQITYIQDKRINIVLTREQVAKLMSRQVITNDIDIFPENQDLSVETEQILTQLNFSENEIAPVKSRRIKYNIQLEERSFNDSIGR